MWFVSDAVDAVPGEHQDGASDVLPVAPVKQHVLQFVRFIYFREKEIIPVF